MSHPKPGLLHILSVVLVVASACSGPDAGATGQDAVTDPPGVTQAFPADVVSLVLPATGAETRGAQGLDAFEQAVAQKVAADCYATHGLRPPDHPPPLFIRLYDVPDLEFIAQHGFNSGAPSGVPAEQPLPMASSDRFAATCQEESEAATRPLRSLTEPLHIEWLKALSTVNASADVQAAYRDLGACFHEHEVRADSEESFFEIADAQSRAAADGAVTSSLATAYATCMRPIEAVREPLRLDSRQRLLADRADQARRLRQELTPLIRELERKHGLTIQFPQVDTEPSTMISATR
ncbi:hypothetical protein J2S43_002243 [Catenuloplanes nepalensis]|uniref:Secreted protein n=1 Tax=Catenuloplanes nepalensis TaxID=587533 RepID=A0ABT9MRS7_9ACTN|nr:hypothetical protein [Catenuloplanes nepalensis]MDP9793731.1 hypothetical protein [Catenuloplanes nepalensis]